MAALNHIAAFAEDLTAWRRHLHAHPELGFDCHETAAFVAARLREFGIDQVETGIATSGIVAVIEGRGKGPTIGLRADMDALPMAETTGLDWASKTSGAMHACGHDGHTTMLLGAARYLAETRHFSGRVALIFQPAEEGPGGAHVMVEDGIMERYDIAEIYALHTLPGAEAGGFFTCPGPIMAADDTFHIDLKGVGGHAAFPQMTRDPVIAAAAVTQAIQTIVSRNNHTRDDLVVSVTQIHTGSVENIIPESAYISGTIRSFDREVRQMVLSRLQQIVNGQAASYGVDAALRIEEGYPVTRNDPDRVTFAADVARDVAGNAAVVTDLVPKMGGEDFAFMLNARPGAYLFIGQGEAPGLHNPGYDFNDDVTPVGASFLARLVERAQPLK